MIITNQRPEIEWQFKPERQLNLPDNHGLDYVKKQPFDLNSPQIAPPVSESISSLASGLIDSFK